MSLWRRLWWLHDLPWLVSPVPAEEQTRCRESSAGDQRAGIAFGTEKVTGHGVLTLEKSCLQREPLDWGCTEVGEWETRIDHVIAAGAGGWYVKLRAHQKEGLSP